MAIREISDIVAGALGIHPDQVAWTGFKLQKAGLLPSVSAKVRPLHIARLSLAVAGARRPIDAAALVKTLERTPATELVVISADGRILHFPAASVPQTQAERDVWPIISASIVSALSYLIEGYSVDEPSESVCPHGIKIRRDGAHPFAMLELADLPGHECPSRILVYGTDVPPADKGLSVTASIDGVAIVKLGRAFGAQREPALMRRAESTFEASHAS